MDALDSSRAAVPAEILAVWRDEGAAQRLRNRFVTGQPPSGMTGSWAAAVLGHASAVWWHS